MRQILEGVKNLVLGRDFDSAAPTSSAVEEMAVRIGNVSAVDIDGVIVKSFVERSGVSDPSAVLALREWAAVPETDANGLSFRCDDTEFDTAFGVDLRIVFAALIGGGGFPVISGFVGLRVGELE